MAVNFCQYCGAQIEPNARFCQACGSPVKATNTCNFCGGEIPSGAVFCSHCGERLSSESKSETENNGLSYVERVALAVETGDSIPDVPETIDERGFTVVNAEDYFAYKAALRRRNENNQKGTAPSDSTRVENDGADEHRDKQPADIGQDNADTEMSQKDREMLARQRLTERRAKEFEENKRIREQEDDNDETPRYDRDVDLPHDADVDVGSPMEFLAARARQNRMEQSQAEEYESFKERDPRYDNRDYPEEYDGQRPRRYRNTGEDNRRVRQEENLATIGNGAQNKHLRKAGKENRALEEQRLFQQSANTDGYYDDRRVDDYDEEEDEGQQANMFTIIVGLAAIAAAGAVIVFFSGLF